MISNPSGNHTGSRTVLRGDVQAADEVAGDEDSNTWNGGVPSYNQDNSAERQYELESVGYKRREEPA